MIKNSSLIVVLGMHRAGTSAMSRALKVLGVELGNALIEADQYNEKGYWEDQDINRLNNQILLSLDTEWHSLAPIKHNDVDFLKEEGYLLRAVELLREKTQGVSLFGYKDPRVAKLLPFWKMVFESARFNPLYILVNRHPLSVCKSLARRDGFEMEKGYLLWMQHTINSLAGTETEGRVLVDYDMLMEAPDVELKKVAQAFNLKIDEQELGEYQTEFVDKSLQHTKYQLKDLLIDEVAPPLVSEIYGKLLDVAAGRVRMEHAAFKKETASWAREFSRMSSSLALTDKLEGKREARLQKLKDQATNLEARARGLADQLEHIQQTAPFRLLSLYRRTLDRVFTPSTGFRRGYDLFSKGVKSLIFEGPGAFLAKFKAWRIARKGGEPTYEQRLWESPAADIKYAKVYQESLRYSTTQPGSEYMPIAEKDYSADKARVKAIAFYLPQFHPIPENDEWWGKGFTEWTNVSKAVPQFVGHYQPHLPGELGFYDLRVPEVMRRQVELAKQYGLYGFCFYYYWFNGKRLLERPLEQFITDNEIDFPFCICWANENWSRRWDGQDHGVLIAQKHSKESDFTFIRDVAPMFTDGRYIRIEGKPLIIVYRANILPDAKKTAERWRRYCREEGIGEIYLVAAQTFGFSDPSIVGFDAAIEFPPHGLTGAFVRNLRGDVDIINPKFSGHVLDYASVVANSLTQGPPSFTLFKTVMTGWDNTPRRGGTGTVFHNNSPALFGVWLSNCIQYTTRNNPPGKQFVFINAWNEWAEGAHLEPDRKYGYAFLQETVARVVLSRDENDQFRTSNNKPRSPADVRHSASDSTTPINSSESL